MILLIILLLISLGFAWYFGEMEKRAIFRIGRSQFRKYHDYCLLLALFFLILIAGYVEAMW